MSINEKDDLIFQHFVDLPNCECVFCSTREKTTGKSRLFLIFNDEKSVYMRSGMKNSWDELKDEHQSNCIRSAFNEAILEQKIPCFSA